jgi:hypothetical protein
MWWYIHRLTDECTRGNRCFSQFLTSVLGLAMHYKSAQFKFFFPHTNTHHLCSTTHRRPRLRLTTAVQPTVVQPSRRPTRLSSSLSTPNCHPTIPGAHQSSSLSGPPISDRRPLFPCVDRPPQYSYKVAPASKPYRPPVPPTRPPPPPARTPLAPVPSILGKFSEF